MKRIVSVTLALLLCVIISGQVKSAAPQKWVTVTGIGPIINNDVGGGKERALEAARRQAVESVVGVLLDSETEVENFMLIKDKIYSQSAGFICGEKVTSQRNDKDNYYITLNACVSQGNLEDNLLSIGICLRRLDSPRTMMMIAEQNVGQKTPKGWWQAGTDLGIVEQQLMDTFLEKGLELIDPNIAAGDFKKVKAVGGVVDANSARAVGKANGAEYVVVGKALVTCMGQDSYGFYNCYADVNIRIVKVDTGKIFGAAKARGKMAHIEEHQSGVRAMQKAADKVAPALLKKITQRCEKETTSGNEYKILVSNAEFSKLMDFQNKIGGIRGVVSVTQRNFSGNRAELEVKYKGRASQLAADISRTTGAAVTGVSANTIKIKLK